MNPIIRLDGLTIRYPEFTLQPVTLDLFAGQRIALVGENGAGKSTSMKAMAGRLHEYEGSVFFDGDLLPDLLPGVRGRIGFLPEKLLGLGWMKVREHLDFLENFYPGWDAEYARLLARRLDVPLAAKVGGLSKGTQVKLSLVAAEAFRPPVLLLDEPTSGIDPFMRREILDLLDEIVPPGGDRLLVFSSHILEDLERIADRVLLLKQGRLAGDWPRRELESRFPGQSLSDIIFREVA
ncbi:MAG: ATP-binding cassette domain-containing protein [Gemmatimonadota bacterium]